MAESMSPLAKGILQGINEAIHDLNGVPVEGLNKSVVYRVKPREIRERLHMSQQEFSKSYGIPLGTLKNWEQGRRSIDATALAYLRAIMQFPKETMEAQMTNS